jgi:hypothetical protein
MKPIVLIHGYSAESDKTTKSSILESYGSLPKALQKEFGQPVVEINLARYISLEDGVTLDDVARALDRCLTSDFPHLLQSGFHAIVHSTGALVIRNWLRSFSPKPAPLDNLVYLAGANFGSGWAHVGKGQFAKWGRMLFKGEERGIRILDALELGSSWTIDLHRHFLAPGQRMLDDYGVREHVIIGTQASEDWFEAPIRYVKEDGADGVVRVAASNVNFNYVRFAPPPTPAASRGGPPTAMPADISTEVVDAAGTTRSPKHPDPVTTGDPSSRSASRMHARTPVMAPASFGATCPASNSCACLVPPSAPPRATGPRACSSSNANSKQPTTLRASGNSPHAGPAGSASPASSTTATPWSCSGSATRTGGASSITTSSSTRSRDSHGVRCPSTS